MKGRSAFSVYSEVKEDEKVTIKIDKLINAEY